MVKYFFSSGSFPPPIGGGSIQYVFNIVSHLPCDELVVHTGITSNNLSRHFDSEIQFKVIRSYFVRTVLGHRSFGSTLDRIWVGLIEYLFRPIITLYWIIRLNPKTVVFTEICFTSAFILYLNGIIRKPIILFAYGEELTKLGVKPLHRGWLRYSIIRCTAIISVSDYTSDLLIDLGAFKSKIHKILPSVGLRKVHVYSEDQLLQFRNELNLNGNIVLLTVSRLEKRKNHEHVIRTLPSILECYNNVKYVIVGGGQLRKELEKLAEELNVAENIIFAGEVDDDLLTRYYRLADLFILPHIELPELHDTEGCPTVFFEACANGVPVISGEAGGVKDVIKNGYNGLIVSGKSIIELRDKVLHILGNPVFKEELIMNGYEVVKNNTPKMSAERIARIANGLHYAIKVI
jgi:phosphatidylinositol alpha-1,6-mannosyltransferase